MDTATQGGVNAKQNVPFSPIQKCPLAGADPGAVSMREGRSGLYPVRRERWRQG